MIRLRGQRASSDKSQRYILHGIDDSDVADFYITESIVHVRRYSVETSIKCVFVDTAF